MSRSKDGLSRAKLILRPLIGYAGNPRVSVSFVCPGGETLVGDAVMNQDVQNSMAIWGQMPQTLSNISTIEMVAIDDKNKMDCLGGSYHGLGN